MSLVLPLVRVYMYNNLQRRFRNDDRCILRSGGEEGIADISTGRQYLLVIFFMCNFHRRKGKK